MSEGEPIIDPRKPTELARACPIDIYLSGSDGAGEGETYFPWPYRLNRTKETGLTPSYPQASEAFILDSAIQDESVETADVIADARRYDLEYVVAADVIWDQDATTERVLEMLDAMDDAGIDAEPIIPLQPSEEGKADHVDHYPDLEGLGDYYALGGVMGEPPELQREAVERFRAEYGDEVRLHGFAFGMQYLPEVGDEPLLDSVDTSTPLQEAQTGTTYIMQDGRIRRFETDRPTGEFALLQTAMACGSTLITLARTIIEESGEVAPEALRDPSQSGLDSFGPAMTDGGGR